LSGQLSLADFLAVEEAQFGRQGHGLKRLDARLKLGLTVLLVGLNVLVAKLELSLVILVACWLGIFVSRTPLRPALWFVLAPAWATVIVVVGFCVGFGHTPMFSWHGVTVYREGLAQGVNAGVRVLAEMTCAAALVLSTPFSQILKSLRWFRVPEILVDTLGYMYRYLFLLWDEAASMRDAARVRGGFSTWSAGSITSGSILASMFIRAYDRSQRIAQAIKARGGE
jgi:cobalt/nickel transport system permease protein